MTFGNVISSLQDIVSWIDGVAQSIAGLFSDVDFTILYTWLPNDIAAVITAIIVVLLFLALFGILRRVLFFLG